MCGEITKKTKACNAANRLEGGDGGCFFFGSHFWGFYGLFLASKLGRGGEVGSDFLLGRSEVGGHWRCVVRF